MITAASHGTNNKRRAFPLSVETNDPWSALDSHSNSANVTGNGSPTAAISGGFARGGESRAPPPPKSPLHGARRTGAANSSETSAHDALPARGVDRMMLLRQMNVTSSAGYQATQTPVAHEPPTRPSHQPPIVQQASASVVPSQQQELSAAQIHKERKIAEAKRRQEVQLMTQEDYTGKPEGQARLARQEERAQMQEEELRMARIVQAEKAHLRAQQLQQQREEEARIKEMYLSKLRLDREEKERIAKEKEVLRKQALELKMKALKETADAKAREKYAARQRQIEEEALVEREHRISEIESAHLAVEDELASAMRQELLAEMERKQQIAAEEAQWKQFEAMEAQKQLEATLKRRTAQAEQYEQDKQRRMEIHRLQKERARLAERKRKQLVANEEPDTSEKREAVEHGSSQKSLLDNIVSSRLHAEDNKTSGGDLARADEGVSSVEPATKGEGLADAVVNAEAVETIKKQDGDGDERTVASAPVVEAVEIFDKQEESSSVESEVVKADESEIGAALAAVEPGQGVTDSALTQEEADDKDAAVPVVTSGDDNVADSNVPVVDGTTVKLKDATKEPEIDDVVQSDIVVNSIGASPEASVATPTQAADVNRDPVGFPYAVSVMNCGDDNVAASSTASQDDNALYGPGDSAAQPEHITASDNEVVAASEQRPSLEPQADEVEVKGTTPGRTAEESRSTDPEALNPEDKGVEGTKGDVEGTPNDLEDAQHRTESENGSLALDSPETPSAVVDELKSGDLTTANNSEPEQQDALAPLHQSPAAQLISAHDAQALGLNPFAQVLHVKDGSPAMEASLQAGDLLVDFGRITSSTANCLLLIADKVKSSVNQEIELVVLRPEQEQHFIRESLLLRPRKWQGKGLLGCQLNPFKWTDEQDSSAEGDVDSDPAVQGAAASTEQAQEGEASASLLLVFYNVAPESIADQVGVKNGDLLMKCGALETVNDLSAVAEYLQSARAEQILVELEIQRWIPEEQQYQQVVLELPVMLIGEPLGCSMTTFAEYYSSSETSSVDTAASTSLSACMDCYYTTLATSVHAAALNGHVTCLEALYEASRQDEQATADPEDQQYNNNSISSVLDWRDSDGRSPLFYACYAQQVDSIRFLLAHMAQDEVFDLQVGADLYGDSPLHAATLSGSTEIVSLLLESKYIAVDVVNATQLACVHVASSFEVLELLGERFNADLLATDADGRMPLSHACLRNDVESVTYLCEKHPDFVDYADASGNTPLHLSAWLGLLDVIKILIKYLPPIALYMPNQDGANPLEIAQVSGFDETAQFLGQCMAANNQDDDEYVA